MSVIVLAEAPTSLSTPEIALIVIAVIIASYCLGVLTTYFIPRVYRFFFEHKKNTK